MTLKMHIWYHSEVCVGGVCENGSARPQLLNWLKKTTTQTLRVDFLHSVVSPLNGNSRVISY